MKRPNEMVSLTKEEQASLRALWADERHEGGRLVIINKICRFNNVDFFTESEGGNSAISFANGRRFVAMEIMRQLMIENTNEANEAKK